MSRERVRDARPGRSPAGVRRREDAQVARHLEREEGGRDQEQRSRADRAARARSGRSSESARRNRRRCGPGAPGPARERLERVLQQRLHGRERLQRARGLPGSAMTSVRPRTPATARDRSPGR